MKNLINAKSKTDLSGFYIVYHGSTLLEKPGTYGISHLMEHLMCKNFDDLQDNFDEDGIGWNAYTSSNLICFYITGLDKYVNKWKYILFNKMKNFQVTQETLDKEKKIVLEEYKDAFNNQAETHLANLYRKIYGSYDAIGQRESIEAITLKDCEDHFNLQYQNPQVINISKHNKFKLEGFVEKELSFPKEKLKLKPKDVSVTYEKSNEFKEKTSIALLSPIVKDKDAAMVRFICYLFGMGLKSPLYQEIREKKGLVYYVRCYINDFSTNGSVLISSETSNENVDEFIKTVQYVLENKEKFITQERFDVVKQYFEILFEKNKILSYENPESFYRSPNWSLKKLFKQKDFNLEKVMEMCDKYFDFDFYYVSTDKTEDWI